MTSSETPRSTQLCFARQIWSDYETPFEFFKNRFGSFEDRKGGGGSKEPPLSQLCYALDPSQAQVKYCWAIDFILLSTEGCGVERSAMYKTKPICKTHTYLQNLFGGSNNIFRAFGGHDPRDPQDPP